MIQVREHPLFQRTQNEVVCEVPISFRRLRWDQTLKSQRLKANSR